MILGKSLTEENLVIRATNRYLDKETRLLAQKVVKYEPPKRDPPDPKKRGRCIDCKDNKSSHYCQKCLKYVCLKHASVLCQYCCEEVL